MNEPPAGARHQGQEPATAASSWRPSNAMIAIDLHPHLHDRPLPGLHQTRSLHQLRLRSSTRPSPTAVNIANNSPVRIAGVDVGKVISRRTRRRRHQGHLHRRRRRPADPRRRLRRDPPADLPRGQLLHRTRPRQPQRAGDGQRRHDPGQPHLDRGPARRDPHRAAVARARRPQPPARGLRHRAHPQADRGRRRHPAPRGARARPAAEALNGALKYGGDAGRYSAQVTNALLGTQPARPLAAGRRRRPHLRRLRQPRGRPAGADRQLRRLHRRPRRPVRRTSTTTIRLLAPTLKTAADLAGQPQPHAAAAAHLRDRVRRPAVAELPGLIARRETVARAGPAAALRQGGRRRRQAAAPKRPRASPAPPRRARQSPLPQLNRLSLCTHARSWSRPATRRSTTVQHRRAQLPRVPLHARPTSPARARTSTATAPTSRIQPGGGDLLVGEPNPDGNLTTRQDTTTPTRSTPPLGIQPQLGGRPPKKPDVRCDTQPGSRRQRRPRPGRPAPDAAAVTPMSEREPNVSRWKHFRASLSRQARGHSKDTIAIIVLAIAGDRDDALDLHPAESLAAVLGAVRRRRIRPHHRRVRDRAGGHPGPGPGGRHRRHPDRQGHLGRPRRRPRRRRHGHRAQVHGADPPRRDACCCGRKPTSTT